MPHPPPPEEDTFSSSTSASDATSASDDAFASASIEARKSYHRSRRPFRRTSSSLTVATSSHNFPPTTTPSPPFSVRRYLSSLLPVPPPAPPAQTSWDPHLFAYSPDASAETWAVIRSLTELRPVFPPPTYPTRSWPVHIFLLPHNALRAELVALLHILNSFARARLSLTLGMIHDLSCWWGTFSHFLLTYFNLEDAVLLPWAYRSRLPDSPFAPLSRALAKRRALVEALANEVSNALALFRASPSGEILPVLIRAIHSFVPRLVSYLSVQEQQVARIVDADGGCNHEIERRMFAFILTGRRGLINIVLLTRWGGHTVDALLGKYVRGVTRIRLAAVVRAVQETHVSLALAAKDRFRDEPRWGERKAKIIV